MATPAIRTGAQLKFFRANRPPQQCRLLLIQTPGAARDATGVGPVCCADLLGRGAACGGERPVGVDNGRVAERPIAPLNLDDGAAVELPRGLAAQAERTGLLA